MNIPKGYRLVPVEPTDEMLSAMWSLMNSVGGSGSNACYEAMIDAAPPPPQPIFDEAKEKEAHMEWFQNSEKFVNEYDQSLYGWLACAQSRAKSMEVGHE